MSIGMCCTRKWDGMGAYFSNKKNKHILGFFSYFMPHFCYAYVSIESFIAKLASVQSMPFVE